MADPNDPFRQSYRPLTEVEQQLMDEIKEVAEKLASIIGRVESPGTAGESIQHAKQRLHEAIFWAIHGITG